MIQGMYQPLPAPWYFRLSWRLCWWLWQIARLPW
jgi:hypothetical protein